MSETRSLRVTDRTPLADDVMALSLEDPRGGRLPDWEPGAHIDLILPGGRIRQYSLCGDRWNPHTYRIAVLRERHGNGSSAYLHDALRTGDLLGFGGPRNNFPLVPAPAYLFVAGGIGITPLLPMIHQADLLGADWHLLYGGRRHDSMAFRGTLRRYGDRVQVRPEDRCGRLDLSGFLTAHRPGTRVYACGPAPLLDAVTAACAALPEHTLHLERFTAAQPATHARTAPFTVALARTGAAVTVPPGTTILDAVTAAGADVLSSCRQGTCGTCETTVLAGLPDHRDSILDDTERATGTCMFICVSGARGDRLVLDL